MPKRNWTREKYKPSSQATLEGKTFGQKDYEATLKYEIEMRQRELARIEHGMKCEQCMAEMILDVERYGGHHLGAWYLDIWSGISDCAEAEYEDCPKAENYDIGSYKNGFKEGTRQFVMARLRWAKELLEKEIAQHQLNLRLLNESSHW